MIPISFEFFPPKTPQQHATLQRTQAQLSTLDPEFYSVTFGAGGSTRDHSVDAILALHEQGHQVAPHISCMGGSGEKISELLNIYQEAGISRLVALRGDRPSGMAAPGEFRYASDLVAFIRKHQSQPFHIEVACYPEFHPESPSPREELAQFKHKVEQGADSAITQYFYNADAYAYFLDECQRWDINIPIVPGIMPITNFVQLARFSDVCGAEIPRWLRRRLEHLQDDKDSLRALGTEFVAKLCQDLVSLGAPGLHFYTLNQAEPSRAVINLLS